MRQWGQGDIKQKLSSSELGPHIFKREKRWKEQDVRNCWTVPCKKYEQK